MIDQNTSAMKTHIHLFLMLLICACGYLEAKSGNKPIFDNEDAENIMIVHDVAAFAGEVITVELEIMNDAEFVGFNLSIPLPEGFEYVDGSAELFRKTNHMLSFTINAQHVARILAFSVTNNAFLGNNGIILQFQLETPNIAGTYLLPIEQAVIGNIHAENIITGTVDGLVTLDEPSEPEMYEVIFNIDARDAILYGQLMGFDPDSNYLCLTGTMTNWAEPGTDPELNMILVCEEQMIFQKIFSLEAGVYEYKYFSDVIGEGWYGGEWQGSLNREVMVTGNTTLNDVFSTGPVHFSVSFIVQDEDEDPINDAIITLGGITNAPGNYQFDPVLFGYYQYLVKKAGFHDFTGEVEVYSDTTLTVTMQKDELTVADEHPVQPHLYPNPAHTVLFIQSAREMKEIRLISYTGYVLDTHIVNGMKFSLDVAAYHPGLYLIQVLTNEGVISKKFIVE